MISKECDIPIIGHSSFLSKFALIEEYNDIFKRIGKLVIEYDIELNTVAVPVKSATKKIPLAMKEKAKEEFDLKILGIIKKTIEPN